MLGALLARPAIGAGDETLLDQDRTTERLSDAEFSRLLDLLFAGEEVNAA